ncbi:MAG: secondary thiamine-phosphate synthase enzyme YjbQ [candidate division Zixibacteria bacterium]|nr:secondary thiamine-phosphate synthase enzyme YjbQ [candidate division Zixibacteria bacterium]
MMVITKTIAVSTAGAGGIVDITDLVAEAVRAEDVSSGTATVFVTGSTGGLTTIEYEPGLLSDLPEVMERLIPSDVHYKHDQTWHDGNGFSHLRAALVGPDITIPFVSKRLTLGTWQQIVFLEFDNHARRRELIVQIMGE